LREVKKNELKERFEEDARDLKKAIKTLALPDCEEVEKMELLKNADGTYADNITAQFYQMWLMGTEYGRFTLTLGRKAK